MERVAYLVHLLRSGRRHMAPLLPGLENAEGTTVFVKNLNFNTTEETLKEVL